MVRNHSIGYVEGLVNGSTRSLHTLHNLHTTPHGKNQTRRPRRRRLSVAATSSASTVPMASIVLRSAALVGWLIKATAATEDATG